jgi:hypothetical protein
MKTSILFLFLILLPAEKTLPPLNAKIVEYIEKVRGTRVDRGECWDLAFRALEYSGAYFDRSSKRTINIYGRLLDPEKEEVLPGDLIQFENVKLEWMMDKYTTYRAEMKHHTAIVYSVNGPGDYQIAHQNTQEWGKRVDINQFKMDRVVKGDIMIYRPVKEKP